MLTMRGELHYILNNPRICENDITIKIRFSLLSEMRTLLDFIAYDCVCFNGKEHIIISKDNHVNNNIAFECSKIIY